MVLLPKNVAEYVNKIVHPGVGDFPAKYPFFPAFRYVIYTQIEWSTICKVCRTCRFGSYTVHWQFSEKADNLSMKVDILTEKSSTVLQKFKIWREKVDQAKEIWREKIRWCSLSVEWLEETCPSWVRRQHTASAEMSHWNTSNKKIRVYLSL